MMMVRFIPAFVLLVTGSALATPGTTQVSGKRIRGAAAPGVYFTEGGGRVRRLLLVR
jgi:hypothetical protein